MNWQRGIELLAAAFAVWFVVSLALLTWCRLDYPYETDWLEGAMLEIVGRVARGEAIYTAPDIHFTMAVYAPLYFWLAGGLASVIGEGFVAPRLVSIVALVCTLGLLFRFVRRAGGDRVCGLLAVGTYAAMVDAGDGYFDATRVDSLFVALSFAAGFGAFFWRGQRGAIAVGGLCALAIATKQSALPVPFALAAAVYARDRAWRAAAALLLTALVPVLIGFVALDRATDGWARYFLVAQLAHHEIEANMWRGFWTRDIARVLPIASIATALSIWWWGRSGIGPRGTSDRRSLIVWLVVLLTGVGIAYASRLHRGGGVNVVFPAWLALSLGFALAAALVRHAAVRWRVSFWIAALVQLALLVYAPSKRMPTAADEASGDRFVAELAQVDGEVLAPFHGAIVRRAGKRPAAHPVMINDVLRSADLGVRERYRAALTEALASRRFARVFLADTVSDPWFTHEVETYYADISVSGSGYRWLGARQPFEIRVLAPR